MIRLLNLFANHLDLNGDAANTLVLQRRAEWGGLAVVTENVELNQPWPTQRPDFVLVGHGSAAAWRQAYPALKANAATLEQWMLAGTKVLAVSSGFAALHGMLPGLPNSIDKTERTSKFMVVDFEDKQIYGYRNSDLEMPDIVRHDNLIGTTLHGPLLAKNSWLADEILAAIVSARPELKQNQGQVNATRFAQSKSLAVAACELAEEQAND